MFGFGKNKKEKVSKKKQKHNDELLKQYEAGRILQVNNDIDNKKHFENLPEIKEEVKEIKEEILKDVEEVNLEDLPEIEKKKNIPDLLIIGDLYLGKGDIKSAIEIYKEIKEIFNPEEDNEIYPQILNYYKKITG